MKLQTYLNFAGQTEEAFNFYKSVFGGEFNSLIRFKDMPMAGVDLPAADADKIMHISLPVGTDDALMASDALESLGQQVTPGNNSYIFIHADSRDEADRLFKGLSDSGNAEMPMSDQPWGDYFGSLWDKYGVGWMIAYSQTPST